MNSFTRQEDEALLQGLGRFVSDHRIPDMLEVAFVRSPYAHAKLLGCRLEKALAMRGVLGVFLAADLPARALKLPTTSRQPSIHSVTDFSLALNETRYLGEAVAVVLAENRYIAEDAVELVEIDYEPLPVCSSLEKSLLSSAPLVHPELASNLVGEKSWEVGDVKAAFAQADFVLHEKFKVHRGTSCPLEARGLVAIPKQHGSGRFALEVFASTQSPYRLRDSLAEMLAIPAKDIWVRSECVGGGFGPKSGFYAEDFAVAWLALKTGLPVRWLEDRREHLLCARQERDQLHDVSVALSKAGAIIGLKDEFVYDVGAYSTTVIIPWTTAYTLPGPYKISNINIRMQLAFTHKVPTMTVRGAGRPEAVFVMERVVDSVAAKLSMDPLDIRRLNLIQPDDLPWNTGLTSRDGEKIVYENVNIPDALEKVAERLEYSKLRAQFKVSNPHARKKHGVGLASYVVTTGRGPYEDARVQIESDGQIAVYTGACPQGQGHHTSLAQVCANEMGVSQSRVKVVTGDTSLISDGFGTFASRSAVNAGNAVAAAARSALELIKEKAAVVSKADWYDTRWENGFLVCGPERIQFSEVLDLLKAQSQTGATAGIFPIEATARFENHGHTFAAGAHGAVVEIDAEAGTVRLIKCVAVHDAGAVINPMIVEGQIHGGVAHGVGNSLLEQMAYDENGQLLSSTFKDYLLPLSTDLGDVEVLLLESPTRKNPLGIKGVGESGTVGVAPAVAAAVEDALREFAVKVNSFPIVPDELAQWHQGPAA